MGHFHRHIPYPMVCVVHQRGPQFIHVQAYTYFFPTNRRKGTSLDSGCHAPIQDLSQLLKPMKGASIPEPKLLLLQAHTTHDASLQDNLPSIHHIEINTIWICIHVLFCIQSGWICIHMLFCIQSGSAFNQPELLCIQSAFCC